MPGANLLVAQRPCSCLRERRHNRALYYTAKSNTAGHFKIEGVAPRRHSAVSWQQLPDGAYLTTASFPGNERRAEEFSVTQASMTGPVFAHPAVGK